MKRVIPGMVAAGLLIAAGFLAFDRSQATGADAKAKAPAAGAPAPAPASADGGAGKTVYTFKDEGQVKEFATLWQRRREAMLRMAVLQSYWDREQTDLAELNQQITDTYHVDPDKSYQLDTDRRALIEQAAPAAPEASQTPLTAPEP